MFLSNRGLRERLPPGVGVLTQFHAWWHIFSSVGSYLHILFRCDSSSVPVVSVGRNLCPLPCPCCPPSHPPIKDAVTATQCPQPLPLAGAIPCHSPSLPRTALTATYTAHCRACKIYRAAFPEVCHCPAGSKNQSLIHWVVNCLA